MRVAIPVCKYPVSARLVAVNFPYGSICAIINIVTIGSIVRVNRGVLNSAYVLP